MLLANVFGSQLLVDDASQLLLAFPHELDGLKLRLHHAAFDTVIERDFKGNGVRFSHSPQ